MRTAALVCADLPGQMPTNQLVQPQKTSSERSGLRRENHGINEAGAASRKTPACQKEKDTTKARNANRKKFPREAHPLPVQ